jgi:hypothetical protein
LLHTRDHSYVALLVAILALVISIGGNIGLVFFASDASEQGNQAHKGVCALRDDLQQRVTSGEEILRTHPHGVIGISPAVIRSQLENQRRTIRALTRAMRCDL